VGIVETTTPAAFITGHFNGLAQIGSQGHRIDLVRAGDHGPAPVVADLPMRDQHVHILAKGPQTGTGLIREHTCQQTDC